MKKLPIVAMTAMIYAACSTSEYDPGIAPGSVNNEPAGIYNMATVMAELAPKTKTVSINVSTGGTFRGNSGTRYNIPANAFVTSTGAAVTGTVEVHVTEFLNKGDMLFSGVLPISNDEPLISGGELLITAQQGGQELKLAPGVPFTAAMPMAGTNPAGMELFVGERGPAGNVNWRLPDSTFAEKNKIFNLGDTIGISSTNLTYCNADRFMTFPDYQKFWVKINVDGLEYSEDSLLIHTFYDEYNGVWGISSRNGGTTHMYLENHIPNIPVHFVAFAIIKGNFYGAIQGATPETGATYVLDMKKTSPQEFKAKVAAL